MNFNLANKAEALGAADYLAKLASKESLCKIVKVSPKRSLNQNSYLHLLLGYFGQHFGYTIEEAKIVYKDLCPTIYKYQKKKRTFYRSSADLTKDEMTKTIDVFRQASDKQGLPLPTATDQGWLREIENEAEKAYHYL